MDKLNRADVRGYIVKYNEKYIGRGRKSAYDVYDGLSNAEVFDRHDAEVVVASGKRWKNGVTARWTIIEV